METEYASKGVAGSGLGLGIAGTVLGLLNGGLGCLGPGIGGCGAGRLAAGAMAAEGIGLGVIAEKDAKIAELTAERYTNGAVADIAKANFARDRELEGRVASLEATQKAEAVAFAEYRASQKEIQDLREKLVEQKITAVASTAATAATGLQAEINRLACVLGSVTKTVIPNSNVCPGWGQVTIAPAAAATPTPA